MPEPRGAMAKALRDAFERAPSVQRAVEQQQKENANPETEGEEQETIVQTSEGESQPGESQQADAAEIVEREIEYVTDLPEILGWEPEQLFGLKMRLSDNEEPVELGGIKDRLQAIHHDREEINRQRAEIEQQRQRLQQEAMQFGQANQVTTERMAKAQQTLAAIQAQYQQQAKKWDERRDLEPGKVALEQQELGQAYAAAQQELQSAGMEAKQQQDAAREQWLRQQHSILAQHMPDWNDPGKRQAKQQALSEFATQRYGVTAQELAKVDARTLMLLNDAMEGVKLKDSAKTAVSAVQQKPRVVPRGGRIKAGAETKRDVAERINKARETKSRRDITNAVRGVLGEALTRK